MFALSDFRTIVLKPAYSAKKETELCVQGRMS